MTKEQFEGLLVFLSRAQLNGQEAPMFMQCVQALKEMYEKSNAPKEGVPVE